MRKRWRDIPICLVLGRETRAQPGASIVAAFLRSAGLLDLR
jgi:hypothetical protein